MALTDHSGTRAPSLAGLVARVKAALGDRSDSRVAQLAAGSVFLVRVANAMLTLLSQVLLARWMGAFEFGVYIYVWTLVLMVGCLSDMGLCIGRAPFHSGIYRHQGLGPPARISLPAAAGSPSASPASSARPAPLRLRSRHRCSTAS